MLREKVYFSYLPDAKTFMPLPDGYVDVWVRKNIEEENIEEEGKTFHGYSAEFEAYGRFPSTEELESLDFDTLFEKVSAWQTNEVDEISVLKKQLAESNEIIDSILLTMLRKED